MASSWQLWLSPRPAKRTTIAHELDARSADNAIRYDFFQESDGRQVLQETHHIDHKIVRDGLSGPPLHIHLRQKEYFKVQKGVIGIVKNGKEHALTKDDPAIIVEPGARHTFWSHASSKEDLVVKIWVDPQDLDYGFDESFMRNFTGYLRDCETQKIAPSIFQLLVILYHSEVVLTPPFWLPLWFLTGLHHVFGYWIGQGLLGYRPSYPEYSSITGNAGSRKKK